MAGAPRGSAKTVRSMASYGTILARRVTNQSVGFFAQQTAQSECSMQTLSSVQRRATLDRTHTLWSAQLARSKKDSSASTLATKDRLDLTTSVGDSAQSVPNSVAFFASRMVWSALPTLLVSARIPSTRSWLSKPRCRAE